MFMKSNSNSNFLKVLSILLLEGTINVSNLVKTISNIKQLTIISWLKVWKLKNSFMRKCWMNLHRSAPISEPLTSSGSRNDAGCCCGFRTRPMVRHRRPERVVATPVAVGSTMIWVCFRSAVGGGDGATSAPAPRRIGCGPMSGLG